MKKLLLTSLAALTLTVTPEAKAVLISYYNFNDLSIATASTPGSGSVPATIAPTLGTGSLSLSGYGGTVDDFGGTTINSLNSDPAEESLSLIAGTGTPGNGTYIQFSLSTLGLTNLVLTYATQGTGTGYNSQTFTFSVDGGATFLPLALPPVVVPPGSFALQTVDFSGFAAINNQSNVLVRATFDGATSASGNNRFDNVQFNAVPEPTTGVMLLGGAGMLALMRRRTR